MVGVRLPCGDPDFRFVAHQKSTPRSVFDLFSFQYRSKLPFHSNKKSQESKFLTFDGRG